MWKRQQNFLKHQTLNAEIVSNLHNVNWMSIEQQYCYWRIESLNICCTINYRISPRKLSTTVVFRNKWDWDLHWRLRYAMKIDVLSPKSEESSYLSDNMHMTCISDHLKCLHLFGIHGYVEYRNIHWTLVYSRIDKLFWWLQQFVCQCVIDFDKYTEYSQAWSVLN